MTTSFHARVSRWCLFVAILLASNPPLFAQEQQPEVADILNQAMAEGNAHRGALVFGSTRFACVSCHQIGVHGGRVGPALTKIGIERKPEEIVESLLFPQKQIKPEFIAHVVVTDEGKQHRGYLVSETSELLMLKDPSTGEQLPIPVETIEARKKLGTLMPDGLTKAMTPQQLADVVRLLLDLGHPGRVDLAEVDTILEHAVSHTHGPTKFVYDRNPLRVAEWPSWEHPVNRDRIYDFYSKQAAYFRSHDVSATLLENFPGLDGGTLGHWGNQNESTWADNRWNETHLGSLQSGVFRGAGKQITRGICVQLENGLAACFDPETCSYPVVWKNGFVSFSAVRHGFMHGLQMQGEPLDVPAAAFPDLPRSYLGLYRDGPSVVFHYRIGDVEYLDAPRNVDGRLEPVVAPIADHPARHVLKGGQARWTQTFTKPIELRSPESVHEAPYIVETIQPPFENPWNALMFFGGHAFLPDGSALLCTMQGDVWHVSNFAYPATSATWKRFATGLHQPQGIVIDNTGIFVLGRDQITRLHDLNNDGEADYYEAFCRVYQTSPAGHDYICGLERDQDGYFYTASGNQGLLRISPDGKHVEVLATGFRNPDGLGLTSAGVVTVPCSEGSWTPASMICAIPTQTELRPFHPEIGGHRPPFFGLGGPRNGKAPDLPLVYLPRGLDNSSGGQTEVTSTAWGPLQGQMLHFSFGSGSHFLLLRDEVRGQLQGGVVPLPGEFRSGAHRGRFSPRDGQLYVSGMAGWGSYTPDDGSFQRVRYTGHTVQLPVGFHAHENGIVLKYTAPLDPQIAGNVLNHFAQAWNYRYSPGYGSPELSTRHYGTPGHDVFKITRAIVLADRHSLFLEIPDLQPVNQLHLSTTVENNRSHDLFLTIHALDAAFDNGGTIPTIAKTIAPHPLLKDVAYASKVKPNPWTRRIPNAREIVLETGTNLSFKTRLLRAKPNEPLHLKLVNPDVVPHNWALIQPGTLQSVGDLSNKLIADPDAFIRHYIPESPDVIVHTDVVQPNSEFTIDFHAPTKPGTYPFLCTFPGHWLVMNGEMIVE